MICEYCGAELSAGDISVIPDKNWEYRYRVICHNCDKTQSSIVSNVGNTFYVFKCADDHSYHLYAGYGLRGGDTD